jgi:hypothetical protein
LKAHADQNILLAASKPDLVHRDNLSRPLSSSHIAPLGNHRLPSLAAIDDGHVIGATTNSGTMPMRRAGSAYIAPRATTSNEKLDMHLAAKEWGNTAQSALNYDFNEDISRLAVAFVTGFPY